ncbi:PREDICTED: uncharacterized protein LOC109172071 [Ipomoea nil]|uniref:uncharacterized protein LOC109172071 n=1 Tax=Ipomoea nil TaxID=35883 RepID=UPI000900D1F9|nr:PREDICTED: uncharacterized protein LOC109172071 [Ipomoea nil]
MGLGAVVTVKDPREAQIILGGVEEGGFDVVIADVHMPEMNGFQLQQQITTHFQLPVIYSSFAIKCGGQEITSFNQIVYERDNETLGSATYYMTSTGRWAVSNVGLPFDSSWAVSNVGLTFIYLYF